jgi:hypothetical protein
MELVLMRMNVTVETLIAD